MAVAEACLGSGGGCHRWAMKVVRQDLRDLVMTKNNGGCASVVAKQNDEGRSASGGRVANRRT